MLYVVFHMQVPSRVRVMRDADNMGNSSVGEKLCKHKYSSYPYCYGEITTEMSGEAFETLDAVIQECTLKVILRYHGWRKKQQRL